MGTLIGKEEITQKQICEISCKNDSNLTRILKGIESKGLIYRQKGQDARSRYVYLSDKGRDLFIALAPIAENYMKTVFQGLTEDEKNVLANLISNIRNRL